MNQTATITPAADVLRDSFFCDIVPTRSRLDFMPTWFGVKRMMDVERAVYTFAGALLHGYDGGFWQYAITRSVTTGVNAPFFIPPAGPTVNPHAADAGWWRAGGEATCWQGSVSQEAAGIIVTLFALGAVWNRYPDDDPCPVGEAHQSLREAAYSHPERYSIFRAID